MDEDEIQIDEKTEKTFLTLGLSDDDSILSDISETIKPDKVEYNDPEEDVLFLYNQYRKETKEEIEDLKRQLKEERCKIIELERENKYLKDNFVRSKVSDNLKMKLFKQQQNDDRDSYILSTKLMEDTIGALKVNLSKSRQLSSDHHMFLTEKLAKLELKVDETNSEVHTYKANLIKTTDELDDTKKLLKTSEELLKKTEQTAQRHKRALRVLQMQQGNSTDMKNQQIHSQMENCLKEMQVLKTNFDRKTEITESKENIPTNTNKTFEAIQENFKHKERKLEKQIKELIFEKTAILNKEYTLITENENLKKKYQAMKKYAEKYKRSATRLELDLIRERRRD